MIPIIIPSGGGGGAVAGVTLTTYRRALADQLGMLLVTTSGLATVGDTTRIVLSEDFRDDEAGYDFMGRPWVYVSSGAQAGTQRRIVSQPETGYQGAGGALVLSRPFSSALPSGSIIEITSPLPSKRHLAVKGLNECINEALALLPIRARIVFTGNGTDQHDLEDYPWLTSEDEILGIYDSYPGGATTDALTRSPHSFRVVENGVDRTLVTDIRYSAAQTFELAVIVRADRLVHDGTGWIYATTPGLQADSWMAAAPERWVTAFGMVKASQFLYRMVQQRKDLDRQEKGSLLADIDRERRVWARAAMAIRVNEFPRPVANPLRGLISGVNDNGWRESSMAGWP